MVNMGRCGWIGKVWMDRGRCGWIGEGVDG